MLWPTQLQLLHIFYQVASGKQTTESKLLISAATTNFYLSSSVKNALAIA